jgi:hypothetical protein
MVNRGLRQKQEGNKHVIADNRGVELTIKGEEFVCFNRENSKSIMQFALSG